MFAEVFGRREGYCGGKGGSMHIADSALGHMGANAIVGGNIPISLGGGFTMKYLQTGRASVAFFGDGALNQGVLYESMNMAALWKLPVLFVVVNNQYGMGTRIDRASACLRFVERAETFGVRGAEVDGMDVEAVWSAAGGLLAYARNGVARGTTSARAAPGRRARLPPGRLLPLLRPRPQGPQPLPGTRRRRRAGGGRTRWSGRSGG